MEKKHGRFNTGLPRSKNMINYLKRKFKNKIEIIHTVETNHSLILDG